MTSKVIIERQRFIMLDSWFGWSSFMQISLTGDRDTLPGKRDTRRGLGVRDDRGINIGDNLAQKLSIALGDSSGTIHTYVVAVMRSYFNHNSSL